MTDTRFAAVTHAAHQLSELTGGVVPKALVVLGSGLGAVVDSMEVVASMPFTALDGYAGATVAGHTGEFVFGHVGATPVLAMRGRIHYYEGHPMDRIVLPVRAAALLGCEVLIATNAAGGIAPRLRVGQTMMLTDHISLLGPNPLIGPNIDELGTRFPAMADAYSPRLAAMARELADAAGMDLAEGVYAVLTGPTFETTAEVKMMHHLGADAVGMSTVPEVIVARHAGMEVAGFSLISNMAGDVTHAHEDVLKAVEEGTPALASLVVGILSRL